MAEGRPEKLKYEPVIADHRQWPIAWLTRHKEEFLKEAEEQSFSDLIKMAGDSEGLRALLEQAIYLEHIRIKRHPWKVDPEDDQEYWDRIEKEFLALNPLNPEAEQNEKIQALIRDIIRRYLHEIAGEFRYGTYKLARKLLPHTFATLLNRKQLDPGTRIVGRSLHLKEKIQFVGHIEHLRKLVTKGTVVLLPTHSSNLDSILIGWGIDEIGLPPFHYGAGLNLFNVRLIAYFMNRLGAYKVDRRKKNKIYLKTLKDYSMLTIEKGVHSLFFPGGTRSRDNRVESKLKLGLLSTAVEAQRKQFEDKGTRSSKVFIVPASINYHVVLEAPTLIEEYLKREGKQRYIIEKDELSSSYRLFAFIIKFLTRGSQVALSFGKPMDVFGHDVDEEGRSLDKNGNVIDIDGYFKSNGVITEDEQRESRYTQKLAEKITDQFYRINIAFSSHLIAFVAFELIRRMNGDLDLFELLRIPPKEIKVPYRDFREKVAAVREALLALKEEGRIDVAPHLLGPVEEVIRHGLQNVGVFHSKRVLKYNKKKLEIVSEDLKLLYFYHNRLEGYGLERYI